MSARRKQHVNVIAAPVRIHGAVMIANARAILSTSKEKILA
jgi:hypothetical protein